MHKAVYWLCILNQGPRTIFKTWVKKVGLKSPWVSRNSCTRWVLGSCVLNQGPRTIFFGRENPSFVTSHPGTQRVQEFLLTQGGKLPILDPDTPNSMFWYLQPSELCPQILLQRHSKGSFRKFNFAGKRKLVAHFFAWIRQRWFQKKS